MSSVAAATLSEYTFHTTGIKSTDTCDICDINPAQVEMVGRHINENQLQVLELCRECLRKTPAETLHHQCMESDRTRAA